MTCSVALFLGTHSPLATAYPAHEGSMSNSVAVAFTEYKGHANEQGVKKVLKSDLDGMFKR